MLLRAPAAIGVGNEIQVQVLRNGRPCPAFAVQMRSELSPVGVWQLTDADGRLRLRPPFAGPLGVARHRADAATGRRRPLGEPIRDACI